MTSPQTAGACDACLARSWLLTRLSGHLDRARGRIWELLALADEQLIGAVAGRAKPAVLRELAGFGEAEAAAARQRAQSSGLELLCCCSPVYPERLRDLDAPPRVVYLAGGIERLEAICGSDPVAIVGARKAGGYGLEVAHSLARSLALSGVSVISGLAAGIDASAHRGTLEGRGLTAAVLPGPADAPYPALNLGLCREIVRCGGVALSELAPGTSVKRWMFLARNRLIAALARLTVVVQAAPGSGSLLTARMARMLGRPVAAVPGRVTERLSDGPNRLLADGALIATDAQDLLDALFSAGTRRLPADTRAPLTDEQARLLAAIGSGLDTPAALLQAARDGTRCLAQIAALELSGRVRSGPGGRLTVVP